MDEWVEIFRGGKQVDSAGREHDGDALIDAAIEKFDPTVHEPPVVIGHPVDNAPAFGWVGELKAEVKDGVKVLLAKFKQVVPEFVDMVKKGMYKKRSAAFYPDGALRHIGFLGAMPPAVKGLADIGFTACEMSIFEFEEVGEKMEKTILQKIRDLVLGVAPDAAVDNTPVPQGATPTLFTEADLAAAVERAASEERAKILAEFAEKERQARVESRKQEITTWCESMIKAGKLTPAMVKFGVPEILGALAEREELVEFGEEKATLYDRFKQLWEVEMPKVITFGETAKRENGLKQITRAEYEGMTAREKSEFLRGGGKLID